MKELEDIANCEGKYARMMQFKTHNGRRRRIQNMCYFVYNLDEDIKECKYQGDILGIQEFKGEKFKVYKCTYQQPKQLEDKTKK